MKIQQIFLYKCFFFSLGALLLLLPAWTLSSAAAPPPQTNSTLVVSSDEAVTQAWSARMDQLSLLTDKAGEVQKHMQDMRKPLQQGIRDARTEMNRLRSLYRASGDYPVEQTNAAQQLKGLQAQFLEMIRPLETINVTIEQWSAQLDKQQTEVTALVTPSAQERAGGATPVEDNPSLNAFRAQLSDARKQLRTLSGQIQKLVLPADATKDSLNAAISDIEKTLPDVWKEYYLPEYTSRADTPLRVETPFITWLTSLSGRLSYSWPQGADAWWGTARRFFLTLAVMAGLGILAGYGTRNLSVPWNTVSREILTGSWVWMSLGLALLIGAVYRHGGVYPLLTLLGTLSLVGGLTSLSRRLREAAAPELRNRRSPLSVLYIPVALGTILLFLDPPAGVLNVVWGVLLALSLTGIYFLKHRYANSKRPLPERFVWGCASYLTPIILLFVFAGYGRFSILLLIALFTVCNFITLGSALSAYGKRLVDHAFTRQQEPMRNTIGHNLSGPVGWALALVCVVPWLWAVPGVRYMLPRMWSMSYTLGQATFDSSRILNIVLLFFVFRLLTALARVGLDRLPDSITHLERGAIPPFKSFTTYALWILYIAIALQTIGVNLTSLTVIAGGLSVGLGFGMQNIFNNLVSGLLLIFGRNILVGDVIGINNTTGTVREVNIRSTTVETAENALVYIPNSSIMTNQLTNWSRTGKNIEKILSVTVPEDLKFDVLSPQLLAAAEGQEHISRQPVPKVLRRTQPDPDPGFYQVSLVIYVDFLRNVDSTLEALRQKISDISEGLRVQEA